MADTYTWIATSGGGWSTPGDWLDTTLSQTPATMAPGAADTATIGGQSGTRFQIVAGPGSAAALTLLGNTAILGGVTANTLTFGAPSGPTAPYATTDATDILAGSTLAATTADLTTNIQVAGSGSFLAVGGALMQGGSGSSSPEMLALDHGRISMASLTLAGGDIYVDPTATVEIGAAGTYGVAGTLGIDANAVLTLGQGPVNEIYSAVTDNGTLVVNAGSLNSASGTVQGTVSGTGIITVGTADFLNIGGAVGVGIVIDANGNLTSIGSLTQDGTIAIGASAGLNVSGDIVQAGPISMAAGASLSTSNLSGTSSLEAAGTNTISISGTLSGLTRIDLGAGSTLNISGLDTNVPINLGGSDTLAVGSGTSIDGAVSQFDTTDLITGGPASAPGNFTSVITGATLNGSTLDLTSDGTLQAAIVLSGNFATATFLTNAVGVLFGGSVQGVLGTTDIALAGGITTGLAPNGGTITGDTGFLFQVFRGATNLGSQAVTFVDNSAIEGRFSLGALSVVASQSANTVAALDIEATSTLAVASALVATNLEVDGSGALLTDAGAFVIAGANPSQVLAANGGTLQVASLQMGNANFQNSATLAVDATGAVVVGSGISGTAGAISIAAGATLSSSDISASIVGDVIDAGTLAVASPGANSIAALTESGTLSGNGAVQVGASAELQVYGDLRGVTALSVGADGFLTVTGTLAAPAALSTGQGSALSVLSDVSGLSLLQIGAAANAIVYRNTTIDGALVVNVGLSTVQETSATFNGNLTVTGSLEVGGNAILTDGGTLSAASGITLDAGATLDLANATSSAPISMAGSDTLEINAPSHLSGTITGFGTSDLLQVLPSFQAFGSTFVTSASLGAGGVLSLFNDGTLVNSETLAGSYAGSQFLTNSAGVVTSNAIFDQTTDITLPVAVVAGLSPNAGVITGATGVGFQVITGTTTLASSVTFVNNSALEGNFTLGSVTVADGTTAGTTNALDIQPGTTLTATGSASITGNMEVNGAQALFSVGGTLSLGGATHLGQVYVDVVNSGRVQASAIVLSGSDSTLIDSTAAIEIGHAGTAAAGSLAVDAGFTLIAASGYNTIGANLTDNGLVTIDTGATVAVGASFTGSGQLLIGSNAYFNANDVNNFAQGITAGASANLYFSGTLNNVGQMALGTSDNATFVGDITGFGGLTAGAGSSVHVYGNISGPGALVLGANAQGTIDGTVSGLDSIEIGAGGTLDITGTDTNAPIVMDANSTLEIGSGATIDGFIIGFGIGDVIKVDGKNFGFGSPTLVTSTQLSGHTLSLLDDGTTIDTLTLGGSFAGLSFLANAAGTPGTSNISVAPTIACFVTGTGIATPGGRVAVERMAVGMTVRTHFSGTARVVWVGHRQIDIARHPHPAEMLPIRVRAHAFGPGLPARDVMLSPDHAVFVEGALVPVRLLVDGQRIMREPAARVTYWHVELSAHDVLFADGLPCESYLDSGNRGVFVNAGVPTDLVPRFAAGPHGAAGSCAPLVTQGPVIARALQLLSRPHDSESDAAGLRVA